MPIVPRHRTHSKPVSYVTIIQEPDGGWHWQRHSPVTVRTSTQSYPDSLSAARAAAIEARWSDLELRLGCNVLKAALVATWQMEGISLAQAGQPADCCWNKYQQQGYATYTQPVGFAFNPSI